jgi:hypothetical protein
MNHLYIIFSHEKMCVGMPCKYCGKWNINCIYLQRQRPGPQSGRINRELEALEIESSKTMDVCSLYQMIVLDLCFIRCFLSEVNPNIPLLTSDIVSSAFSVLFSDSSKQIISPESWACVSLVWTACAIGASACRNDRFLCYMAKAREALQKCVDIPLAIVARACLGLDILRHIYPQDEFANPINVIPSNFFSDASLPPKTKKVTKQGIYHALAEAVLSQLEAWEVDDGLLIIMNTIRSWNATFAESVDELLHCLGK